MQEHHDQIAALADRLSQARGYLRIDELLLRKPQLEAEFEKPNLWDDADAARRMQTELAAVNDDLALFTRLGQGIEDTATLLELSEEDEAGGEPAGETEAEITGAIAAMASEFDELELRSLFTGEHDDGDAVCFVKSGEGGTDAQDWAELLLRMYRRWAERRGFEVEIDSVNEGQEAGISSAEFLVRGRHAYGLLQSEHGVHRLVRLSPFNKDSKRQTAFASLQVVPFFDEVTDEVEIDEKDLRIDTYRSSGAGGQHVNVTDSAVRITHLPTGIVVSCQNERSQHQNKDRAMQILAARLLDLERQKREEELAGIAGEAKAVGFGSQIRSYVMQPYQMVKDLRSSHETGDVDSVLDGDLDPFMEAFLRWRRSGD